MANLMIEKREIFGKGSLTIDPSRSVFINCPFDNEFAPLFDAIVFATVCCGFIPRSTLESGDVAEPRIKRILHSIISSKYSIHDLSRCKGEGEERLARFNMPLELGMAMALRFMTHSSENKHDWLIIVPEGHQYIRFISDLAGYDLKRHNGTLETVVRAVMSWLVTRPEAIRTPTPKSVLRALPAFNAEKMRLEEEWGTEIPWADIIIAARNTVPSL